MSSKASSVASFTAFSHLQGQNFVALTTYRKSGVAVTTPIWFAQVGDRLYCLTEPEAGKLKRLRNNPKVEVAPCNVRGKLTGPSEPALARPLTSPAEQATADAALGKKYGLQKKLFQLLWKVQRITPAYFEIRPVE